MTVSFRISITIFQAFPTTFSRVLPEFARKMVKNFLRNVIRTLPENYFFIIALNPGDGMIYGQDLFNSRNLWDEDFLSE